MAEEALRNPFVGPRPFDRDDGLLFFGRNREVRELLSLIVSSRVVLLYSASGAGKTSLLNARVIPLLEAEEGFEVLPPARVGGVRIDDDANRENVYVQGVLSNWARELGDDAAGATDGLTLAGFLAERPRPPDARGFARPRALVFDQFEELFTVAPKRWKERKPFLGQIAEALEADPLLRVVIAMREDYVAQLDPHAEPLLGGLRSRFRLERLGQKAALRAVTGPLETTDRRFDPGVAESLVNDLLTFHVDTGTGEPEKVEGEFVEPVQLQVACHSLWTQLPPDVKQITDKHLVEFGDVDEVLGRYYDGAVHAAASAAHKREGVVRRAIEESFITKVGTRGTAIREAEETGAVPNAAVDALEARHVVRAERRAGARWYELTHDRLIEPIQASNRRYRELRRRKRLRWQAAVVALLLASAVATVGLIRYQQVQAEEDAEAAQAQVVALNRLLGPAKVFRGHADYILSTEFQRNGNRFVSSSWDGTARIWEPGRKAPAKVLGEVDTQELQWAAFSRDGRLVGTASQNQTAQIWDVATGRRTSVLRGHTNRVATIAFAPDGRVVTSSDDGTARIWQPPQARPLVVLDTPGEMYTANFDDPGLRVVTGGTDRQVRIWDARTGTLLQALNGHRSYIQAAVFDRSGTRVATASNDATARIWTLDTGRATVLKGHKGFVYAVAFNRSGTHVVTASADGTARVWDLASGKVRAVLRGHVGEVFAAGFSSDGSTVVTGGGDTTVRLWDWRDPTHRPQPARGTVLG
jgi:WD40 repeat protein